MVGSKDLKKCAVPFCQTVGTQGFYQFPSDPRKREDWVKLIGLTFVRPRALVCHNHFTQSSFSGSGFGVLRRLKKNARPELNLPVVLVEHNVRGNRATENVFTYNGIEIDRNSVEIENDNVIILEAQPPVERDHDYSQNSEYWAQAFKDLDKVCTEQRKEITKLRRQLNLANQKLKKYEAGNFTKKLIKQVCQNALIGKGKFMSKAQLNWMLDDRKRERSRQWDNLTKAKVCYFTFLCNTDMHYE